MVLLRLHEQLEEGAGVEVGVGLQQVVEQLQDGGVGRGVQREVAQRVAGEPQEQHVRDGLGEPGAVVRRRVHERAQPVLVLHDLQHLQRLRVHRQHQQEPLAQVLRALLDAQHLRRPLQLLQAHVHQLRRRHQRRAHRRAGRGERPVQPQLRPAPEREAPELLLPPRAGERLAGPHPRQRLALRRGGLLPGRGVGGPGRRGALGGGGALGLGGRGGRGGGLWLCGDEVELDAGEGGGVEAVGGVLDAAAVLAGPRGGGAGGDEAVGGGGGGKVVDLDEAVEEGVEGVVWEEKAVLRVVLLEGF